MYEKLLNRLTNNRIKKAVREERKILKKHYEKKYRAQEKRHSIECKKIEVENNALKKQHTFFLDDKEHLQTVFEDLPEQFHEITQNILSQFKKSVIEINKNIYQSLVPPVADTIQQMRRADRRIKADKTSMKICESNFKNDRKIEKIIRKEQKL